MTWVIKRYVIAPYHRQAMLFIQDNEWNPQECGVILRKEDMRGRDFSGREVWWVDKLWPCRTHEDVHLMEEMHAYAKYVCRGDLRHWWT